MQKTLFTIGISFLVGTILASGIWAILYCRSGYENKQLITATNAENKQLRGKLADASITNKQLQDIIGKVTNGITDSAGISREIAELNKQLREEFEKGSLQK